MAVLSRRLGELSAPRTAPAVLSVAHSPDWDSPEPLPGGGSGRSGVGRGEVGYHSVFLGQLWPVTGPATTVRIPPKSRFLFSSRLKSSKNRSQHRWWGGVLKYSPVRALFFQHSCTFSPPFTLLLAIRRLLSYFSITIQNTCMCVCGGGGGAAERGVLTQELEGGCGCVRRGYTALLWPFGFLGH